MDEEQNLEQARTLAIEAQRAIDEAVSQSREEDNPELMAALLPILEKRRADYLAGRSKTYTLEESMKKLRERLYAKVKQSPRN